MQTGPSCGQRRSPPGLAVPWLAPLLSQEALTAVFSSLRDRCKHRFIAASDERPLRFSPSLGGVEGVCSRLELLFTTPGFLLQKVKRVSGLRLAPAHCCNVGNANQPQPCLPTQTKGSAAPRRGLRRAPGRGATSPPPLRPCTAGDPSAPT